MPVLKRLLDENQIGWIEIVTFKKELEWFFQNLIGFSKDKSSIYAYSSIIYLTENAAQEIKWFDYDAISIHPERFTLRILFKKGLLSLKDLYTLREEFKILYSDHLGFDNKQSDHWASVTVEGLCKDLENESTANIYNDPESFHRYIIWLQSGNV